MGSSIASITRSGSRQLVPRCCGGRRAERTGCPRQEQLGSRQGRAPGARVLGMSAFERVRGHSGRELLPAGKLSQPEGSGYPRWREEVRGTRIVPAAGATCREPGLLPVLQLGSGVCDLPFRQPGRNVMIRERQNHLEIHRPGMFPCLALPVPALNHRSRFASGSLHLSVEPKGPHKLHTRDKLVSREF